METSVMARDKARPNIGTVVVCALIVFALFTSCSPVPNVDSSRYALFADSSRNLTVEQAYSLFKQRRFVDHTTNSLNPGFTTWYYWIAVETDSSEKSPQMIEIGTSQLNEIIFYEIVNGKPVKKWITGDYFPFQERPNPSLNFSFPIINGRTYLIRTNKVFESLQLTFKTVDANRYANDAAESALTIGLMSGAIALMIVFGIFLFAITRDWVYLLYCLYVAAGWMYVMANQGYGFKYFWPNDPWFAQRARPVFTLITICFSLHFLELYAGKVNYRWLRLSMRFLLVTSYILFVLFSIPSLDLKDNMIGYIFQAIIPILAGVYVITILIALIEKLLHRNRMAMFYLLSIAPILLFSVLQIIYYSGGADFSGSYIQTYGQATGYVLEAIILTFGLAFRFNTYKLEKEQALINLNEQQTRYARAIITTQETERRQIADQLHDIAGSLLSAARLNLSSVREKTLITNADAQKKLETAENAVSDISDMLRNMSHAISPVMLDKVGFRQAVEKVVNIFNSAGKIDFELEVLGFENEDPTMYEKYSVLYGMLYELLNNIVKHAKASHGLVQLVEHDDSVVLIVEDNGIGMDENLVKNSTTHGLAAITSKIHYLHGQMTMDKAEPKGLIITIEIPKNRNGKSDSGR